MSTPFALRLLGRLKFRGTVRRQWRRMKTPKGAILTVLGVGLFSVWIIAIVTSRRSSGLLPSDPETLPARIAIGALGLTVLSMASALAQRGLFIPRNEIERLLAAPVSRSALIRYRLRAGALKSLTGGLIVGLMAAPRMPQPLFAFIGILIGMQTLPILHQLFAILLGSVENRIANRLQRFGRGFVFLIIAAIVLAFMGHFGGPTLARLGRRVVHALFDSESDLFENPLVLGATQLFMPWVRMIGATTAESFALWAAVSIAILCGLFELTARLPIDFRELSLATSANVAARIRRAHRGGGAASGKVSKRTVGWRIPWFFGRGPAGAVAWRKTGAIVRRARGTLMVSVVVLAFVTFLAQVLGDKVQPYVSSALIGAFGTMYLCAGLRFDFRDELDRMEVIKSWPVPPARIFLAMLLPETCLVSLLLVGTVLVSAALGAGIHPVTLGIALVIPPVALAWVALDNAVFLFAPVRFVPGQEGALQNAGRGVVVLLIRAVMLSVVGVVGALAFAAAHGLCSSILRTSDSTALAVSFGALLAVLVLVDLGLVWLGGRILKRFDVARDRG